MTEEVRIKRQVWDSLELLGGAAIRLSAKGFSRKRDAAAIPLTYLLAASHVRPAAVKLDQSVDKTVEALARLLHRRVAVVILSSSTRPTVHASKVVRDDGSRLSLVFLVKDLDGAWRWVMWEDRATLDLPHLLAASCPGTTNPIIDAIREKLLSA